MSHGKNTTSSTSRTTTTARIARSTFAQEPRQDGVGAGWYPWQPSLRGSAQPRGRRRRCETPVGASHAYGVGIFLRPRQTGARWQNVASPGPQADEQQAPGGATMRARQCGASHVQLRTYIVEDNATIRENLIGTLEELASHRGARLGRDRSATRSTGWPSTRGDWDLAIVDLFLKQGSGLGVLEACRARDAGPARGRAEQLRHARHAQALRAAGRRRGVRQVQRDRRADRLLHRAGAGQATRVSR